MQPAIDLYAILLLIGAAHGLFLAFALLHAKGGDAMGHRLLALLTLLFCVDLGLEFLEQSRYLTLLPRLVVLDLNIDYLFGPLTYLYVRALTDRKGYRFTTGQWLHFLPFALGFLILMPVYSLTSEQIASLIYIDGETTDPAQIRAELAAILVALSSIVQMALYLIGAMRCLARHRRDIQNHFSYQERISLSWLRNLLIALSLLYVLYLAEMLLIGLLDWLPGLMGMHYPIIVLVIYTMGYLGLRQPLIFARQSVDPLAREEPIPTCEAAPVEQPESRKYQKSALDSETSALLYRDLQAHMKRTKPHLDSHLTLSQLASQLSLSANYLSQVINEQAELHFFDFINSYRVAEAKAALLANPQRGNILAIALEAGFNSKSAFYTAFKRHTGQTPSQFRLAAEHSDTNS